MKKGHIFGTEHGFTGSTNDGKEFRPKIHGFKRGGHVDPADHEEYDTHPKHKHPGYDKQGFEKMGGKGGED
jgi:hypothetical protein